MSPKVNQSLRSSVTVCVGCENLSQQMCRKRRRHSKDRAPKISTHHWPIVNLVRLNWHLIVIQFSCLWNWRSAAVASPETCTADFTTSVSSFNWVAAYLWTGALASARHSRLWSTVPIVHLQMPYIKLIYLQHPSTSFNILQQSLSWKRGSEASLQVAPEHALNRHFKSLPSARRSPVAKCCAHLRNCRILPQL